MSWASYLCPYFLLIVLIGSVQSTANQKLILLFIDGLRWDMLDQDNLPGFRKLFDSGTRAEHLQPVFPSLCYPNFYTMMTGLYPESHGLIGNNVYDPIAGDFFMSRRDPETNAGDHWWHGGEPLWVTAQKQRKESYLYYMAGCGRKIHGHRPSHCRNTNNEWNLGTMFDSLQHGVGKIQEGKADFVAVYYGEIDTIGHRYGPTSPAMKQKVKELDQVILYLLHDLWERGLSKKTNVVLISDHGMTDASIDRTINLRRMLNRDDLNHTLESGAYVSIWPKEEKLKKVYMQLKSHPHLQVYLKHEIPDSWHYKGSHRVAPITAVAELGWFIETHESGYLGFGPRKKPARGMHGYHTDHPDMWGVFAAVGPAIEMNQTVPAMGLVDVYQALSFLLDLKPLPHNGTWDNVAPMFRKVLPDQEKFLTSFLYDAKVGRTNYSSSSCSSAMSSVTLLVVTMLSVLTLRDCVPCNV